MDSITKLKEITKKLHKYEETPKPDALYECEDGQMIEGYAYEKTNKMAIQKAFLPKGCTLKNHAHEGIEYLIIYEGKIKYIIENGVVHVQNEKYNCEREGVCSVGDSIVLPHHSHHIVTALENTWLIGITIPADEAYPNG